MEAPLLPRRWRRSLTCALPIAALLLGSCAPPPDFPTGSDVVLLGDAADVFPARGQLEHVSENWVVLRQNSGKLKYIPVAAVTQMTVQ